MILSLPAVPCQHIGAQASTVELEAAFTASVTDKDLMLCHVSESIDAGMLVPWLICCGGTARVMRACWLYGTGR